jgi:hypothetical protein
MIMKDASMETGVANFDMFFSILCDEESKSS